MLTINEVASMFSVSRVTIWRWAKEIEDFPKPIKIGGSTRWRERDIERYLSNAAGAQKDDA
jgi:predicted DNA-binding transcriptional regulator AlpA